MPRVFMGGTANGSPWRDKLASLLQIEYTNPVVKDWKPEDKERELVERNLCDWVLYVLTPNMTGLYSIAELIDDSNKQPNKTLFCILYKDTSEEGKNIVFMPQIKSSLASVAIMAKANGAKQFETLEDLAYFLNNAQIDI